jgi:hypothetical protein
VTVLDRPEVVEQGREEATASGLDWHAADLFEPWGLTADVVLLRDWVPPCVRTVASQPSLRVLHDWEDDAALPWYLEGVFFWEDGDDLVVTYRDRETRRTVPTSSPQAPRTSSQDLLTDR